MKHHPSPDEKSAALLEADRTSVAVLTNLSRDPVVEYDFHTKFSRATQDFSRNFDAQKRLKAMLSFVGVISAHFSCLDITGCNDVSLNRMSIFVYKGTAARFRLGKHQGIVTLAKGNDGEPVTPEQMVQRWDRDRFLASCQPARRHRPEEAQAPAAAPAVPEAPAPTPAVDGEKLRAFLRTCCEHRRKEDDTIDVPQMRALLAGMNGTAPARRVEVVIEAAEAEGLLVAMDDERTLFGFEAALLPAVLSGVPPEPPVSDEVPLPPVVPPPAATGQAVALPVSALLSDLPNDLLSLLATAAPKMRERERVISRRAEIAARVEANAAATAAQVRAHEAAMADLSAEQSDLERQGREADAEIAKSDQLHQAIEALRVLNQ